MKTSSILLSIMKWAVISFASLVGFIFGTVVDTTIFLIVRPSLPPPWCWLPPLKDYSVPYFSLLGTLVVLLLWVRYRCVDWRSIVAQACVISWSLAFISRIVVEVLGEREGPRMGAGELIFTSTLIASTNVVNVLISFFVVYCIAYGFSWVYSRLRSSR